MDRRARETMVASLASGAVEAFAQGCRRLVDALGCGSGPRELGRTLGVGVKAAWQVHRLVIADHPLDEAINVPRPGTMRTILRSARRRGVPGDVLDELADAHEAFERVVLEVADDRASFDTIAASIAPSPTTDVDLPYKRASFRASRHLYGMHSAASIGCMIVNEPRPGTSRVDVALVDAVVRYRLLRPDRPPYLVFTHPAGQDTGGIGEGEPMASAEPLLRPEELTASVPLLTDFCSRPLPEMRTKQMESGLLRTELITHGLGNQSETTFAFANMFRNVPGPGEGERIFRYEITLRIPARALVIDILSHREAFPVERAEASIFSERCRHGEMGEFDDDDRMPLHESVVCLGSASKGLGLVEMPRYAEMIHSVLERLGWDPDAFDVYRCRVDYPVVQTAVENKISIEV